ncbi:MAG: helix-turn-helix transcriptional regulator, partial [Burkholderiales bacterium]|nr:helix-turn-helix transcriptional regulator [Opitutaceae bacterium]
GRAPEGSLGRIVERWRREPQRAWSLEAAAKEAGLSYTRFRTKFLAEFGTSPYDYVLRLRIELAERWLTSTDEAVKLIAVRCGFGGAEAFVRAFGKIHGISPGKWRVQYNSRCA